MNKMPRILLVEDNEGDAELVLEALENEEVKSAIPVIDNGEDAISYLKQEGKYENEILPSLILLDLNLPKSDGKEVLSFIKNNTDLKKIPVIILTTSALQSDVDFAYDNHANCYIVKSGDLNEFNLSIQTLEKFWMHSVLYPNKK
ncbi:MAG: response regulator [Ferruginibacter sp.]